MNVLGSLDEREKYLDYTGFLKKEIRTKARITIKEAAEEAGIPVKQLYDVTGKRSRITADELEKLAKCLTVHEGELVTAADLAGHLLLKPNAKDCKYLLQMGIVEGIEDFLF